MSELTTRHIALPAQAGPRDPREDRPAEARRLREDLAAVYGAGNPLPDAAGGWLARFSFAHTRKSYARGPRTWEACTRERRHHPLAAGFPLADAFARHLETAPTRVRVKGGAYGETAPTGKPRAEGLARQRPVRLLLLLHLRRATVRHARRGGPVRRRPPPEGRPGPLRHRRLDPGGDRPPRRGGPRPLPTSPRLVVTPYTLFLRVDSLLALDVEDLDDDRGHHVLRVTVKGGRKRVKPLPPLAHDALTVYLDGRTTGPLFTTRTGRRLGEPEVWKCLRRLAAKAGLEQAATLHPHVLRHNGITDALEAGIPLPDVQDAADHRDPRTTQRYNRRRRVLENHPGHQLAATLSAQVDRP